METNKPKQLIASHAQKVFQKLNHKQV